ncbi:phytoene desaturase [bacterium]|nr:MAG: phytoene desaturase [bacterium]
MKRAIVIGAGFGGMSAAAYLAKDGYEVTVVEKNAQPGGRAYTMKQAGFVWELGPSWYMMPDVFEEFFADFGHKVSDYYELKPLTPAYRVFDNDGSLDIGGLEATAGVFDRVVAGDGAGLRRLLAVTERDYQSVRANVLTSDWLSWRQAVRPQVLRFLLNPEMVMSYDARIKRYIQDERLVRVLEFMTVFMGGSPSNIPGMYSLLAYVDMGLGISYPVGGFTAVARAFMHVGQEVGVTYRFDSEVAHIETVQGSVRGVKLVNGDELPADLVVANADYHHIQTQLLSAAARDISESKWARKTLSPSGLLVSLGVKGRLPGLLHHNLFLIRIGTSILMRFLVQNNGHAIPCFTCVYPVNLTHRWHSRVMKTCLYWLRKLPVSSRVTQSLRRRFLILLTASNGGPGLRFQSTSWLKTSEPPHSSRKLSTHIKGMPLD